MSIFGPDATTETTVTADGVKVEYVDTQDNRRVLKTGDNMTGTLQMNGNLVRGLPRDYPPMYTGDEAISWEQAVGLIQDAVKKRVITIWAEVRRRLGEGKFQWSFGDSGGRHIQRYSGYTMLAPGRVIRMGLAANVPAVEETDAPNATVCLVCNGAINQNYCVTKPHDQPAATVIFNPPLELAEGDVLNFYTETTVTHAQLAVVTLLIELDL